MDNENTTAFDEVESGIPPVIAERITQFLNENKPDDITEDNAEQKAIDFVNGLITSHFRHLSFVTEQEDGEKVAVSGIATKGNGFSLGMVRDANGEFLFLIPSSDEEYHGTDYRPLALIENLDDAVLCAIAIRDILNDSDDWETALASLVPEPAE